MAGSHAPRPGADGPATVRHHDLRQRHRQETAAQRYRRVTAGSDARWGQVALQELVLGLLGGIPGAAGLWLRGRLYPLCFRGIRRGAYLGRHVTVRVPRRIALAPGVVIDDFAQLVADSERDDALRLGEGSFVRSFACINAGPPEGFVHIGARCGIGQGAILYGHGGLTIGDDVLIAGHAFIVASSHDFGRSDIPIADQGYSARGIRIGDGAWIGAGARILDGVTIGRGAIVGANAVVTRSVADGARVAGVPARPLPERRA